MIRKITLSKKIFFTALISLTSLLSFAQQNNEKQIKKLKRKFEYVSEPSQQLLFIAGNRIVGPSDGGGGYLAGVKDLKIIDLEGNIIKETELNGYKIIFQFGKNYDKYSNLYNLQGPDGKIGLINTDGKIIIPPTYNHINGFNSKGQAVAFTGNDLQVIDANGNPLLKENFKYKVDYSSLFTIPTPGEINYLYVVNDNIICSKDENHYGVVNITSGKTIIPFEYDKIDKKLLIKYGDTIGHVVYKNNLSTIVDFKTNKELAPFSFERIDDAFRDNGNLYIYGIYDVKTYTRNYYDVKNKKMVFQKGVNPDKATPFNNSFWILEKDRNAFLYNIVKNEMVKMPEEDPRDIKKLTDNLAMCTIYNQSSWIFDVEKNKIVLAYPTDVRCYPFTLNKDNCSKDFFFIYEKKNGNYRESVTMYDRDLNSYFSDLYISTSYYENDRIVIKEEVDGKYPLSAYDIEGKVIGEKRAYKLK
ncbi:WG repeat protein [Flavobacterium sp. 270]|uniref:WG repeat-containing protein n=1 Tax=Flavobacterium sp. 270 TaxID=2512114 RepID=UPI0010660780|nr:WG repeat-containing protein [Flavobacterium sp. 270]TDW44333.1 WG repeat protein [Flavobacterium sp. 270]